MNLGCIFCKRSWASDVPSISWHCDSLQRQPHLWHFVFQFPRRIQKTETPKQPIDQTSLDSPWAAQKSNCRLGTTANCTESRSLLEGSINDVSETCWDVLQEKIELNWIKIAKGAGQVLPVSLYTASESNTRARVFECSFHQNCQLWTAWCCLPNSAYIGCFIAPVGALAHGLPVISAVKPPF